jgi:hypothetical protein
MKKELTAHLAKAVEVADTTGKTPEQIADGIIDTIAAATPWTVLIPGVGATIDAMEAAVVKTIVHGILVALAKKKIRRQSAALSATRGGSAAPSSESD